MPIKATESDEPPRLFDWPDGLTWIAHPSESMQRASHALAVDGDVWLVDPVDAEGIDEAIVERGDVAGVVVLLDRHTRDAAAFARRHDVRVHLPDALGDLSGDIDAPVEVVSRELAGTGFRIRPVVRNRFWREVALVADTGATAAVPEALVTADLYTAPGEQVAVHPFLRPWPPRQALGDLGPGRLLVGHGPPVLEGGRPALRAALAGARRRAPAAYWSALVRAVRG